MIKIKNKFIIYKDQSDVVRNLEIEQTEVNPDEDYDKTTLIKWKHPCRANNQIDGFRIMFSSGDDITQHEIPYVLNQSDYIFNVDYFEPNINYNVGVAAYSGTNEGRWSNSYFKLKPGSNFT